MFIENEEDLIKITNRYGDIFYKNKEGEHHRLNGPAIIYSDGTKYWMKHGEYHRLDGPAIEYSNGEKEYYLKGRCYSEEIYWEKIKGYK